MLCRGLKFSIPKHASSIEIKASFESLLETRPTFTGRSPWPSSVYPRFCYRKGPKPPWTLLKAIHQLKKHDGIVITNPGKGSSVVVMDKEEYLRLLAEASINDATEFRLVDPERPTSRGRPPKHYHPLLRKEKELQSIVRRILPTWGADSVRPSGSRLSLFYGLPKTHQKVLAMRSIKNHGSWTYIISYTDLQLRLGKMASCKTQLLSTNQYTITDTFDFFVNEN